MKKVVTFGEIMLRLTTPGYQRFIQATSLNATFGGGEVNVAASLSNYGIPAILLPVCRKTILRTGALPNCANIM
jgi:hypothetical protein